MFVAHIRMEDGEKQPLVLHLTEVQKIAEEIGVKLNIRYITGIVGLLHDMGKYSDAFQRYILAAYQNPDQPPKRGSVNHSSAGGHFLAKYFSQNPMMSTLVECMSNAIFSHHGQLLDYINENGESPMYARMQKEIDEYDKVEQRFLTEVCSIEEITGCMELAVKEFQQFLQPVKEQATSPTHFQQLMREAMTLLTKYIFSALIDADRTNSRAFDEKVNEIANDTNSLFGKFSGKLEQHLAQLQKKALPNNITELRQQMSDSCYEKALLPTGVYTLSIPTGGGKTLASLRFALRHALQHNKKRIIYVVPFTTIIEQNASEVRALLDAEEHVLEHHSNVLEEIDEVLTFRQQQQKRKMQSMKDQWDAPIIFTTMVQFLNTFYSGRSRNERRLHNLAESIIIFDEVQSVPIKSVSLFNTAVQFLNKFAHSTVILCTATQPALDFVKHELEINAELVDDLPRVEKAFKRTKIQSLLKTTGWKTTEIADFIEQQQTSVFNSLIIMNNKISVLKLYEELKERNLTVYHLSTSMCPAHRKEKIAEIRMKLKARERFICVSTQLIEAGVDVSFDCVMRSLAGLDSIAQAAGRCNRHGEGDVKNVYVFNHAEENVSRLKTIEEGARCAKLMLLDLERQPNLFDGEILSSKAMTHYFQQFYTNLEPLLKYPTKWQTTIYDLLFSDNLSFVQGFSKRYPYRNRAAFRLAAREFEVIEAETTPVLVPYGEGQELINQLLSGEYLKDVSQFFKKAQQYSVNVFPHVKNQLGQNQLMDVVDLGFAQIFVAKAHAYDTDYGLNASGEAKMSVYDF